MIGTRVSYLDEQQRLEGYLAAPNSARDLPGVLVVPSWLNVNESICKRADRLAELGYVAFVVDLFGAAVRPGPPQSPTTVVGPFLEDRLRFRRRLSAGLRAFQGRPECNAEINGRVFSTLIYMAGVNRYAVSIGILYAKKIMSKNSFIRDLSCCDSPTD
jgi:hypothetical protein